MRLDSYLVETGFLKSRGRAKRAIEEGKVKLNGVVCTKPSKNVSVNDKVDIEEGAASSMPASVSESRSFIWQPKVTIW